MMRWLLGWTSFWKRDGWGEWTQRDRMELRDFLATDTGRKLVDFMLFWEKKRNRTAVDSGSLRNCMKAVGFRQGLEFILRLSDIRPPQEPKNPSFGGDGDGPDDETQRPEID